MNCCAFLLIKKNKNIMSFLNFDKIGLPVTELVYKSLFEVDIHSSNISDREKFIVRNNISKITKDVIIFNINCVDNKVIPFSILNKLQNNAFNLQITLYSKDEVIIGSFILFDCLIKYDINEIIDFDHLKSNDTLGFFEVNYSNSGIKYVDIQTIGNKE